jgi:hypothetical protein
LASLFPFLKGMFNIPTWLIHQVIFATLAGQNATRLAAERYAVRVEPRTRPLKWRLKQDLERG